MIKLPAAIHPNLFQTLFLCRCFVFIQLSLPWFAIPIVAFISVAVDVVVNDSLHCLKLHHLRLYENNIWVLFRGASD